MTTVSASMAAAGDGVDVWAGIQPDASRRMVLGAVAAFSERGYHATSTRDIATAAGLSPAALYVHYPSKAALLAKITDVGHTAVRDLVREVTERPDPPVQRLADLVHAFTTWHARHHRIARVIQYEWTALPDEDRARVVAVRRDIEARTTQVVRDGVQAGQMLVDDARRTTRAVLSLGIDVARWYDPARHESPEELGRLHVDLALRMVGASVDTAQAGTADRSAP